MVKIREMADILLPLYEPALASVAVTPDGLVLDGDLSPSAKRSSQSATGDGVTRLRSSAWTTGATICIACLSFDYFRPFTRPFKCFQSMIHPLDHVVNHLQPPG
jgi:hypothetical protein